MLALILCLIFVLRNWGLDKLNSPLFPINLLDGSIKYPRGVIEDVLVKVDRFIFPVDFIVLDIVEDRKIPLIDVKKCQLVLRLNDEKVDFNVFH